MKTQITKALMMVLMIATSVKASADEGANQVGAGREPEPYSVLAQNYADTGRSMWVTMYNMFDSIRETACIKPGQDFMFTGYYPPLSYYIRGEIKENLDCSGATLYDTNRKSVEPTRGQYAKMVSYPDGGRTGYEWIISLSPIGRAQAAKERALQQAQQVNQPAIPSEEMMDSPNGGARIQAHNALKNGKSVWVTIYNGFDSIRDYGCVQPGEKATWDGYYDFGLAYKVRFEVKSGANCSGNTDVDTWAGIGDISGSKGVRIMNYTEGGQEKTILSHYDF